MKNNHLKSTFIILAALQIRIRLLYGSCDTYNNAHFTNHRQEECAQAPDLPFSAYSENAPFSVTGAAESTAPTVLPAHTLLNCGSTTGRKSTTFTKFFRTVRYDATVPEEEILFMSPEQRKREGSYLRHRRTTRRILRATLRGPRGFVILNAYKMHHNFSRHSVHTIKQLHRTASIHSKHSHVATTADGKIISPVTLPALPVVPSVGRHRKRPCFR